MLASECILVSGLRVRLQFPVPYADGGAPTSLGPQSLCEQSPSLTQTPDSGLLHKEQIC